MNDVARLRNGLQIRRPKLKANLMNEARIKACVSRFDSDACDRLQFLRAVSHAVGAHTDELQPSQHADSSNDDDDDDDDDEQFTPTAASASAAASVPGTPAAADTPSRCCEVCLLSPIEGFALVPCEHARFCENCARRVADEGGNCPLCRAVTSMVMRVFA